MTKCGDDDNGNDDDIIAVIVIYASKGYTILHVCPSHRLSFLPF
jgi:hypothetical protein